MSADPFVVHDVLGPVAGRSTGPLAGVTFAVKDMIDVAGARASGGNPDWLAGARPARRCAPVVERLLGAGATLVGRTVCDELFYNLTGVNDHLGTPANPAWPGCLPGGSSSGSAAAVAAGRCDVAVGSDTAGSIRIPAAFCGVHGVRTTTGSIPATGVMAMAPSFDALGWFARDVDLLSRVGGTLLPPRRRARLRRVLVARDLVELVDPSVATAVEAVVASLGELLGPPEDVVVHDGDPGPVVADFGVAQAREFTEVYGAWLRTRHPSLGPTVRERVERALEVDRRAGERAATALAAWAERLRARLGPGTVLVLPTAPCPPPPVDAGTEDLDGFRSRILALTVPASAAGLPQVSLAVPGPDGPLGVSLAAGRGADRDLLELAAVLEERGVTSRPHPNT